MSEKQKRRRWTASEKLRVVLAGLDGSVEVSELCRRDGINLTQCEWGLYSRYVDRRFRQHVCPQIGTDVASHFDYWSNRLTRHRYL